MYNMASVDVGQKVRFSAYYSRKCHERFSFNSDLKKTPSPTYILVPLKTGAFEGYIVGIRNVIMSDYKYHAGDYSEEGKGRGYATGKTEKVLLVAETPYREPVIVRSADVT